MSSAERTDFVSLHQRLTTVRYLNDKCSIYDAIFSQLYGSLTLSNTYQIARHRHRAAVLSLDIERGENRYLLCGGTDWLSLVDLHHANDARKCLVHDTKWANGKGKTHRYAVTNALWYPRDSGMFVSGSLDESVVLWDTNKFAQVLQFKIQQKVYDISINASTQSHNPLIAVASEQRNIYLCDVLSNSFTHSLIGHSDTVRCVAFHPSNEYLIASGAYDGCIRIWDIRKAGCVLLLDESNLHDTAMHSQYEDIHDEARVEKLHIQSHRNAAVCHLQWSNHYRFHLYSSGTDKKVRKWRVDVMDEPNRTRAMRRVRHRAQNTKVNFRPSMNDNYWQRFVLSENDEFILYPNYCDLSIFSTVNGKEIRRVKGPFSSINCIQINQCSQVVTGDQNGNILLFAPQEIMQNDFDQHNFVDHDCWSD